MYAMCSIVVVVVVLAACLWVKFPHKIGTKSVQKDVSWAVYVSATFADQTQQSVSPKPSSWRQKCQNKNANEKKALFAPLCVKHEPINYAGSHTHFLFGSSDRNLKAKEVVRSHTDQIQGTFDANSLNWKLPRG